MKAIKKEIKNNSLDSNVNKDHIKNINKTINQQENRRKLYKILKYLTKNLNININDIQVDLELFGSQRKFYPTFSCFHSNLVANNSNLLLTTIYLEEKEELDYMVKIAKQYFTNFDNLYFTLIFSNKLVPHLFYKDENEENTNILLIDSKDIKPFN